MTTVWVGGRQLSLRDDQAIGKGGEADVYDIGDGLVLKVFKPPNHPDFQGNRAAQEGARQRIEEHQAKLPVFPKGLPSRVISPREIAYNTNTARRKIVGYDMVFLKGTEAVLRLGEKSYCLAAGVTDEQKIRIFRDLYRTVFALHEQHNVVVGDFNDLNALIKGDEVYLIDADSMQFGPYLCRVFTNKFVDPRLCDPNDCSPMLCKPHDVLSDWYAYLVLLMQSLLFVDPFGGVYKPSDKMKRIPHHARSLHRITVWHPEVTYPKPARPMDSLPDRMLDYFRGVFQEDRREIPPLSLLDSLQFRKDGSILVTTKPVVIPTITKEIIMGTVRAEKIFETTGRILFAVHQGGTLRWLYHHAGAFKREDESIVIAGFPAPDIRFRIAGEKTVIAQGPQALVFTPGSVQPERIAVDMLVTRLPLIDALENGVFYVSNGELKRKTSILGNTYSETIGGVLANHTLFWTSEKLGFGFYRAGRLARYFVFDPRYRGINDGVKLPPQSGQLVDSTCVFGRERAWFFLSTHEGGHAINRCFLIDAAGQLLASAQSPQGDGSWLGTIRGKCAIGDFLLVATDDGIQRVQAQGSQIVVAKEFPDTARVVESDCHLFPGHGGLLVVKNQSIWSVSLSSP